MVVRLFALLVTVGCSVSDGGQGEEEAKFLADSAQDLKNRRTKNKVRQLTSPVFSLSPLLSASPFSSLSSLSS